jgi:predicted nucleotidyltransferase
LFANSQRYTLHRTRDKTLFVGVKGKIIGVMTYSVNTIIEPHKRELSSLCERYRVAKLYIFGSVVNGDFDSTSSDIDFLAQFKDRAPTASYAERFLGLEGALQSVFKRPVDLLTVEGLKSSGFRNTVEQTRLLIYESDNAL